MKKNRLHALAAIVALSVSILSTPATAQWQQTAGPEGARIFSMAADRSRTNTTLLASDFNGQLYRYSQGTGVWARVETEPASSLTAGGGNFFSPIDGMLKRSTDKGS